MSSDKAVFFLQVCKFISIILTGVFGIVGIATEFRDKATGKITKWGKIALAGVVVSALIAVITSSLELYKEHSKEELARREAAVKDAKDSERTLELLSRIDRGLSQIGDIRVDITFQIQTNLHNLAADDPIDENEKRLRIPIDKNIMEFQEYLDRITETMHKMIKKPDEYGQIHFYGKPIDNASIAGGIMWFDEPLMLPDPDQEVVANEFLNQRSISLQIFKSSSTEESLFTAIPDISCYVRFNSKDLATHASYTYIPSKETILQHIDGLRCLRREDNGNVLTIPDLAGATMLIWVEYAAFSLDDYIDIESITLSLSQGYGRRFKMSTTDNTLEESEIRGGRYYIYKFPDDLGITHHNEGETR